MMDSYIYVMVALLPLTASMVIFQANPYHALVARGILGAIAAMVYAILGAPDVALTEALVGTMLAVMLYAIAVRSSLVMRLGVLKAAQSLPEDGNAPQPSQADSSQLDILTSQFRQILDKHHMRLELIPYADAQTLRQALIEREVHTICLDRSHTALDLHSTANHHSDSASNPPYQTLTRIQRLYEILNEEIQSPLTSLNYVEVPEATPSLTNDQPVSEEVPL